LLACTMLFAGCNEAKEIANKLKGKPAPMPDSTTVAGFYKEHENIIDVAIDGNVVDLRVQQPVRQLLRGGALWARVGPFIYLLSPGTEQLFQKESAVAAVRVTTVLPDGEKVAWAQLKRDTLSDYGWKKAINLLARALRPGATQPRDLEELRIWGEQQTTYWYNPDFIHQQ
jgi:hypothetical protein